MKRLGALFLVVFSVTAGTAHAATYYVSLGGNDGFSCGQAQSIAAPKRTVGGGLSCLSGGGDTLLIRAGRYDEAIFNGVPSGSNWSNKVRIAAYPGETVWISPTTSPTHAAVYIGGSGQSYIEFDGINVDGSNLQSAMSFSTVDPNLTHHIRVRNAEIIGGNNQAAGCGINLGGHFLEGNPGGYELINLVIHGSASCVSYGIYVAAANSLVENCDIYDVGVAGIHIYNGGGDSPDNNIIRNNRIHALHSGIFFGSPQQAIWGILVNGRGNQIYNNLIFNNTSFGYDSAKAGISTFSAGNTKIWNNTITGNNVNAIIIDGATGGTEIKNNIAYNNAGNPLADGGIGTTQSNNLFGVDPSFVNTATGDFRLGNGSPAVDAGAVLAAVTADILGTPRPQGVRPDIGAFEHPDGANSGSALPPAPPQNVRIVASN